MDLGKVPFACERYVEGKRARQPFSTNGCICATKVLELVHLDVCRTMRTMSMDGGRPSLMISQGNYGCMY